jgi:hypothetical protein
LAYNADSKTPDQIYSKNPDDLSENTSKHVSALRSLESFKVGTKTHLFRPRKLALRVTVNLQSLGMLALA